MSVFLRYLMAFAVQLTWQRTGKRGALPPVRLPFGKNKGSAMPIPLIGPWQMMIAMWLIRQVWTVYGGQVKSKLKNAAHPMANHIGNLLPDSKSTLATQPIGSQHQTQPLASTPSTPLSPGSILNSLRKKD